MKFAPAEIINGTTVLCFDRGELGLVFGSDGTVELVPNTSTAAITLNAIRSGAIRPASGSSVSLRIALDHDQAHFISLRDGGEARSEGQGRRRPTLKLAGT